MNAPIRLDDGVTLFLQRELKLIELALGRERIKGSIMLCISLKAKDALEIYTFTTMPKSPG